MPDGSKLPYRFMKYRIHKILLVCCSYDGYILEEDGHIESQINQEYIDLNMSNPPSRPRVSSPAAAPQHPRGAADLLFEGYLPPHRGAGPLGTGLHLLVARQHGTDHRHHQTDRGQDERRRGHPRRGRAGHPSGRGLDPLLFHLFTGDIQTAAAAKHRIPEGRLQRAAAGAAQTRAPENPAGALLRGGRGTVRALQEKPAGRDLRRGVRAPPQRPARERETRRRHRPLPPHPGG